MKQNFWIYLFLIALAGNVAGIQLNIQWLEHICKPLLIPLLVGYFFTFRLSNNKAYQRLVFLALFFSWLGDVLLMFVPRNENFFLAGLSSFLLAHIFYIVFYQRVKAKENIKNRIWAVLAVALYYWGLIYLLSPQLGEMKLPVRIYGIVISLMCMLALHMFYLSDKKAGLYLVSGSLLFVISDSVLAINKFYQPFEMAGLCIMLTYGLAQLLIVKGAGQYISSK